MTTFTNNLFKLNLFFLKSAYKNLQFVNENSQFVYQNSQFVNQAETLSVLFLYMYMYVHLLILTKDSVDAFTDILPRVHV